MGRMPRRFVLVAMGLVLAACAGLPRQPNPMPPSAPAGSGGSPSPAESASNDASPSPSVRSGQFRLLKSRSYGSRDGATATLLDDGRVLVVGGYGDGGRSAEVWDPMTEAFSATGDTRQARHNHTATLLPDGRVFVSGGTEVPQPDEIWDPATGEFGSAGDVGAPEPTLPVLAFDADGNAIGAEAARVVLADGRILLAGSSLSWTPAEAARAHGCGTDASILDPVSHVLNRIGPLKVPRGHPVGVLLSDGRVLIVGNHFACTMPGSAEILEWD